MANADVAMHTKINAQKQRTIIFYCNSYIKGKRTEKNIKQILNKTAGATDI
jgi:hypothetical protein